MADRAEAAGAEVIAGIEARGFVFGAAMAARMGLPFVPVRKPGKLPVPVLAIDYALEYGTDTLEVDPGAVPDGARVVVIDDLIATGGTALAAVELLRRAGGEVVHSLFAIDLPDLGGAQRLRDAGVPAEALMAFEGH
jgi:adenine phosphoribosyltransferase